MALTILPNLHHVLRLYPVVSDKDWGSEGLAEEYSDTNALLVRKSALTCGFSDEGN
ncbi:TPA: hypothetical protein ACIA70_000589 [Salmonella enterica subsp. enterica serovar Java]